MIFGCSLLFLAYDVFSRRIMRDLIHQAAQQGAEAKAERELVREEEQRRHPLVVLRDHRSGQRRDSPHIGRGSQAEARVEAVNAQRAREFVTMARFEQPSATACFPPVLTRLAHRSLEPLR